MLVARRLAGLCRGQSGRTMRPDALSPCGRGRAKGASFCGPHAKAGVASSAVLATFPRSRQRSAKARGNALRSRAAARALGGPSRPSE